MKDPKFEIKRHIATLSESENGIAKELNIVSWNDKPPVWDIRAWSNNKGKRPYKGITLDNDELVALRSELIKVTLEDNYINKP